MGFEESKVKNFLFTYGLVPALSHAINHGQVKN